MKKIYLLAVIMVAAFSVQAANYTRNATTNKYDYSGPEVASLSVDFSTWAPDSLVDPAVGSNYTTAAHSDMFEERGNMGFHRFVIYQNRWLASGVTKNALFNNGKGNVTAADQDTIQPAIYLPTIQSGIKSITVYGTGNKTLWVHKRNDDGSWSYVGGIAVPSAYGSASITIDDATVKTVMLLYNSTSYLSITNIEVEPMEATTEEPSDDPTYNNYRLDQVTGKYDYIGEPVDEFEVDFSNYATTDLPATLSDDMALVELGDLGLIKWKIASRPSGSLGTVNALFNNDNGDFAGGPKNNATTNRPTIYLPTTTMGVDSIYMFGGNAAVNLTVYYKDNNHTSWTQASTYLPLVKAFDESHYYLGSEGPTSIYITYGYTSWIAINTISLVMNDTRVATSIEEVPALNSKAPMYNILGQQVDENYHGIIIQNGYKYIH